MVDNFLTISINYLNFVSMNTCITSTLVNNKPWNKYCNDHHCNNFCCKLNTPADALKSQEVVVLHFTCSMKPIEATNQSCHFSWVCSGMYRYAISVSEEQITNISVTSWVILIFCIQFGLYGNFKLIISC